MCRLLKSFSPFIIMPVVFRGKDPETGIDCYHVGFIRSFERIKIKELGSSGSRFLLHGFGSHPQRFVVS